MSHWIEAFERTEAIKKEIREIEEKCRESRIPLDQAVARLRALKKELSELCPPERYIWHEASIIGDRYQISTRLRGMNEKT